MDFKDWAPFRLVDAKLLSKVRSAYVFGSTGLEALIITDDDEVLACGKNMLGCLGLGNEECQVEPVPVPELSKKQVKAFAATSLKDGSFVCAYTFAGTMYYWCKNFKPFSTTIKPTIFRNFQIKVSKVACGCYHCAILSTNGQVFCCGDNTYGMLGNGTNYKASTPCLVQGDLTGKIVIKISCGSFFSACVLYDRTVYGWGYSRNGELGMSRSLPCMSPIRVPDISNVKKIVCGTSHMLAINRVNELFSWGSNEVGALGLGDTVSCCKPTRIETIGKVINIAARNDSKSSVAMTENSEVYMWGDCGGLNLTVPTKTTFETMYEVFAYFSDPRIMVKPMKRHCQSHPICESIKYSFGDTETSDLTIVVEDKEIFVHKVILKLRSNYFKVLLKKPWIKEDEKSIKINQNYEGIHAYLQYIYTGHLKATLEVALESLKIADEYQDLVFKKVCEKSIGRCITVVNVASLFSWALKLNAKDLIQSCMLLIIHHLGEVMGTAGCMEWDTDTYRAFILECQKRKIRFS